MIDSIFIVHKKTTDLIFYAEINEENSVADLEVVLGTIVNYAQNSKVGRIKNIGLSQGKFVYGNFDNFYMIFLIASSTKVGDVKRFMAQLAAQFQENFKTELEEYQDDADVFVPFNTHVSEAYGALIAPPEEEQAVEEEVPQVEPAPAKKPKAHVRPVSPKSQAPQVPRLSGAIQKSAATSASSLPEDEEEISDEELSDVFGEEEAEKPDEKELVPKEEKKPEKIVPESIRNMEIKLDFGATAKKQEQGDYLIPPRKRDLYPEGIPAYSRDEILWNEADEIIKSYNADFIEGQVAFLEVFLDLAPGYSYRIEIDFRDYPKPLKMNFPDEITQALGKPWTELSYFYKRWDEQHPPHPIELVQELERILMDAKRAGQLKATADFEVIADSLVLEPLEGLSGLKSTSPPPEPKPTPQVQQKTPAPFVEPKSEPPAEPPVEPKSESPAESKPEPKAKSEKKEKKKGKKSKRKKSKRKKKKSKK